jgi:RimJ/RimL family protein N-acetyltransferase
MVPDDLDDLAAVLGAPDPARPGHRTRTREDTELWIAWNQENYRTYGFGLWALETRDGRVVGDCGLTMQDVEGELLLEVGYHIALDLRGVGLATEAATAVREAAAAAGEPHLLAIIRPDNVPSQRVAEKIGLRLERRAHKAGGEVLVFGTDLQRGHGTMTS